MAGTQAALAGGNEWDDFDGDMNAALDAEVGAPRSQGDTAQPGASPDPGASTGSSAPAAGTEAAPPVILTADGKHALPYDVLIRERKRAQQADRRARHLEEEIARLRNAQPQPGASTTAAVTPPPDAEGGLTPEELAALEEDDPLMAKAVREIRETRARVHEIESQVQPVVAHAQRQAETEADQIKIAVAEAIDQTPALRWLRDRDGNGDAEAQALWDEAVRIDEVLKQLPKYRNASYAERFAAVAEELQAAHGAFALPPEYLPAAASTETAPETARQKAERIVQAAQQQPGQRPMRLSQLDGGASPEALPTRLSQMSAAEMFALQESMSEEEFDRLGREATRF